MSDDESMQEKLQTPSGLHLALSSLLGSRYKLDEICNFSCRLIFTQLTYQTIHDINLQLDFNMTAIKMMHLAGEPWIIANSLNFVEVL